MKRPDFWNDIESELEQSVATVKAPSFESSSQVPTLGDRLVERVAAGTAPLYLMSLLVMALLGFAGHTSSLIFAPLLSLLFCWVLAPFVAAGRGVSFTRVLLCAPVVVGFTVVALLLPLQLSRSYFDGTNKLATIFVHDLQWALEAVLEPTTLLFLVLGCIFWATMVKALLSKRPWLDAPKFHNGRMMAGSLLVAVGVVVPGFVILTSPYSQPAQNWRDFTEETLRETPAWGLPKLRRDELWDPVLEERSEELAADSLLSLEARRRLEPQLLKACRERRPNSRAALWSAARGLEAMTAQPLPQFSKDELADAALYLCEYRLIIRADYGAVACQEALSNQVLPRLLSSDLGLAELKIWEQRLQSVREVLAPDELRELDFNAYEYFYGESRTETIISLDGDKPARAAGKARPLKVFGREFSPSPTEIASRYEDAPIFEDWFELRAKLREVSLNIHPTVLDELRAERNREQSSYPNLDGHFIDNLESRVYYRTLEPILSAAQLIADLRVYKAKNGDYPDSLSELRTPEEADRWSLTRVVDEWQLRDRFTDDSHWILP